MHGILFKYLKAHVEEQYGAEEWTAAMDAADIEPKLYLPVTEYPDDEALALVDGVVAVTGADRSALLEAYGERLAPELLDTFSAHVRDDWDAMDLLAHPDNDVFAVLHSEDGGADDLAVERQDADTVVVHYASPLELCELAEGVLRGIVAEHGDPVTVSEGACMHRGADHCELTVRRG